MHSDRAVQFSPIFSWLGIGATSDCGRVLLLMLGGELASPSLVFKADPCSLAVSALYMALGMRLWGARKLTRFRLPRNCSHTITRQI